VAAEERRSFITIGLLWAWSAGMLAAMIAVAVVTASAE